jgi:hypothetical protein
LGALMPTIVGDIRWTKLYWTAVAASVGKTVVTTALSYLASYLRGLGSP